MPLDYMEALADLQPMAVIFNDVKTALAQKPTTFAGWVKAFGLGSVLLGVAEAADALKKGGPVTPGEVITVLGLQPDGPICKMVVLGETIVAQIKS